MRAIYNNMILLYIVLLTPCSLMADAEPSLTISPKDVFANYERLVFENYQDVYLSAVKLQKVINGFLAKPSKSGLEAAKRAWLDSREAYGQSEAFRFYDGPIDGPNGLEGRINPWPLDEIYIDYGVGATGKGIINDLSIAITKEDLLKLHEGGAGDIFGQGDAFDPEKSVSSGYHAIEFLLWGQDLSSKGPGARPFTDYTSEKNAQRRALYLKLVTEILVDDLHSLVSAWDLNDEDNYRGKTFRSMGDKDKLAALLSALGILAKGELAGERIDVALQNQSQEDEQSCFSDNTHRDIYNNSLGLANVYLGRYSHKVKGASLSDLVRQVDSKLDAKIQAKLNNVLQLASSLPTPFDQVIISPKSAAYQQADDLVVQLHEFAGLIVEAAKKLGLGQVDISLPE